MLAQLPPHLGGELLVDESTGDDAAVFRTEGDRVLVQTVDFFTPIVDDPYLFGSIAAANAVSDVYAMGATPILGLAIAGFPVDRLPLEVLQQILRGGADKAGEAGFPVAGGHTIIEDVPKYGLVVTGVASADAIVRNSTGRAGDLLFLTKPLGNGILVAAHRGTGARGIRRFLSRQRPDLDEALRWMTMLNRDAALAMAATGASAATDVTGYGLVGHLLGMCRGAGVGARIRIGDLPLMAGTRDWLTRGFVPEGTRRNLAAFRAEIRTELPEQELLLACDAQTSGGLLVAIPPDRGDAFEAEASRRAVAVWRIGELTPGLPVVELVP